MKKQLLIVFLTFMPLLGMAHLQINESLSVDTVVFINGRKYIIHEGDNKLNIKVFGKTAKGDTIADDMVYEATYNNEQTTERRFEFSVPFQKDKNGYHFHAHNEGMYIGYAELNKSFGFGSSDVVDLRSSSTWEIGFNLISGSVNLTNDGHWGLTSSLGWGYRSFRLEGNNAFCVDNGITAIVSGSENNTYSESRLRYNFFRLPLCIEWQTKFGRRVFISGGIEPEWRYSVKSKAKVNGASHTLESDLNVYPVTANALLQAGYGNIGFYARCAMSQLFKNNKGPKVYPCSFGIVWFW